MKIKTAKAEGATLDWLVTKCESLIGYEPDVWYWKSMLSDWWRYRDDFNYSTDWAQGGSIIEREKIRFDDLPDSGIRAFIRRPIGRSDMLLMDCWDEGITPLIAAMRCYVASKLGDEVDVPDELS